MTPIAPKKSLGVRPFSVLVVTFLKNSPEVCPLGLVTAGACATADTTIAPTSAASSGFTRSFIVLSYVYDPLFQSEGKSGLVSRTISATIPGRLQAGSAPPHR